MMEAGKEKEIIKEGVVVHRRKEKEGGNKMENKNQKDQLFNEHLKYTGKTLDGEGTRKDNDGKDIAWKKWKLNFESGKQYPWQCTAWSSLSPKGVLLKDMEEGKYYEVVYKWNEYQHEKYGMVRSKVAVLIKDSEESKSTQEQLGNKQSTGTEQPKKVSADGFVEFVNGYKEAMKKAEKEPNNMHMLGAYIVAKHTDQFSDIITLCKKEFEKKEIEV